MYPSLKTEQGDNFLKGSISYRPLCVRMQPIAKLPAIVPTFSRDIKITSLVESCGKVP